MKKLVILAALATMSISGSAMAVARGGPARAILIEGASAGTATFNAVINANGLSDNLLAPNGTCLISMTWTNPNNAAQSRSCTVREVKTTTNPNCPNMDINTTMYAGSGFNTNCSGFNQFGMAFGPQGAGFTTISASIVLGETALGTPSFGGTFRDPFSFGFIQGITIN
ncbi:hypothetical protein ACSRUE_21515 [Sorangium sp. KYC3313]|uniref:hypothetical protein n=1 Tax=unclassified Sorangium TaxID=2621164 RepID=UPI003F62A7F5